MVYVNGEPEGKFTYKETIKLYCIICNCSLPKGISPNICRLCVSGPTKQAFFGTFSVFGSCFRTLGNVHF